MSPEKSRQPGRGAGLPGDLRGRDGVGQPSDVPELLRTADHAEDPSGERRPRPGSVAGHTDGSVVAEPGRVRRRPRSANRAEVVDRAGPVDVLKAPDRTAPPDHDVYDSPFVTYRAVTMVVSGAALALLLLLMMLVPLPYAVQRPGLTVDTLSEHDGEPLITVDGAETYPTSGELRLTTVSVSGGPGYPVTAVDVLAGWVDRTEVVVPREAVFPDGTTREEIDEESSAQMASSQTSATVAALEELGYEVPMVLTVSQAAPGSSADEVLQPGDVITSIRAPDESREVQSFSDLSQVLGRTPPGTVVGVGIERDGSPLEPDVTTMAHPTPAEGSTGESEGSLLGVVLEPDIEVPVDISFDIDNIGGPSAGVMFALGIVDRLSPGEMTGGEQIAGTGTMNLAGEVGAIGGIRQKLAGASRDGAEWFLAPGRNCDEVVGHVPGGLRVVRVETLAEARDAVDAIGSGAAADLPTCTTA